MSGFLPRLRCSERAGGAILETQHSIGDEAAYPLGKDVRGDPCDGRCQQPTEVSPLAEDDVEQDEKAPLVVKRFHGGVDRASGARFPCINALTGSSPALE